jgi:NADPH-dependent glutamate synthase beta subunit-like oxidoreductase
LQAYGFEAVFLSLGLSSSRKIDLDGAELEGVLWGLEFLKAAKEGQAPAMKEKVMVIGGGNVDAEVALTALRLGAKEVTLACLEKREEMPANPWEIEMALEEGISLLTSWGPHKILGDNGRVIGIELIQCTSVFDAQGYFCPLFGEAKESLPTDQVILAVGQTTDISFVPEALLLRMERNLISIDPETLQTNIPGVFAGGDIVKGPGTIIEAIASGRKAASAIDTFFGGDGIIEETLIEDQGPFDYTNKRGRGFAEVEVCLSEAQAMKEAARCLQCDLEICIANGP